MANNFDALHDYHVTSVMVDAVEKAVVVRAAYPDRRGPEFAEAVFHGVAAYRFDGDALGTILFEIVEVDPVELYLRYAGPMQTTIHQCGGHAPWAETEEMARQFIVERKLRGFIIQSSIGLTGAIWAADCRTRTLTKL